LLANAGRGDWALETFLKSGFAELYGKDTGCCGFVSCPLWQLVRRRVRERIAVK
jgi:hypothetical protein